jgi:hypothetical protein
MIIVENIIKKIKVIAGSHLIVRDTKMEFLKVPQSVIFNSSADMNRSVYDTNYDGKVDTCDYIDGGTF